MSREMETLPIVTPARTPSGAWGFASYEDLKPGTRVQVQTRGGKSWSATVGERVGESQRRAVYSERHAPSIAFPLSEAPAIGCPTRLSDGRCVVFERQGKSFYIDEGAPSIYGSRLLGFEGERGAEFEYRDATADEAAAAMSEADATWNPGPCGPAPYDSMEPGAA